MKTENDFNAELSKKLKKYSPEVHTIKISDKFTVGISDFLIMCMGKTLALETKFEKSFPQRQTSQVLSHPFSGAQLTFLESVALAGNMGYGMVAIEETQKMYVFPYAAIPVSGNFTRAEFESRFVAEIPLNEMDRFLLFFFNWRPKK